MMQCKSCIANTDIERKTKVHGKYYWVCYACAHTLSDDHLMQNFSKHQSITTGDKETSPLSGMAANIDTTTNEQGGKQSDLPYRFDLIPMLAFIAEAGVLYVGAKTYGVGNWKSIPIEDHLNHAMAHIAAYLSGDKQDDHLTHASCRIHFANELALTPVEKENQ